MTDFTQREHTLIAIGSVVEDGKLLENVLHFLLAGFISPDQNVANIAAKGNAQSQLRMLGQVCQVRCASRIIAGYPAVVDQEGETSS